MEYDLVYQLGMTKADAQSDEQFKHAKAHQHAHNPFMKRLHTCSTTMESLSSRIGVDVMKKAPEKSKWGGRALHVASSMRQADAPTGDSCGAVIVPEQDGAALTKDTTPLRGRQRVARKRSMVQSDFGSPVVATAKKAARHEEQSPSAGDRSSAKALSSGPSLEAWSRNVRVQKMTHMLRL